MDSLSDKVAIVTGASKGIGVGIATALAAAGADWLTDGLDDDDEVVVQGAGVLWSLQGMAGRAPDDDDD